MIKKKKNLYDIKKDKQFFWEKHYLRHKYFCPFFVKNLCSICKDFNTHINCVSLFDCEQINKIRIISWNSYNDNVVKNLNELCKILEYSYYQGLNSHKICLKFNRKL